MKKPNFKKLALAARMNLAKHSPEILLGIGITGMVSTTVLAVKATPKALQLIEEEKNRQWVDDLKPIEVVKVAWKPYIPAAMTCAFSITCLIGANSVHAKRNAALVTAYKLSESALIDYRDKVIETIGEKKEQVVQDKIAKEKVEKHPVKDNEVILTGKGTSLCMDAMFGRYFESDIESIRRAMNNVNRKIVVDMYASLNEFYDEIGLGPVEIGDIVGWNIDDGEIKCEFSSQLASDGRACTVVNFNKPPKYEFSRFA